MDALTALIEQEVAKLRLLEQEVAVRKQRIANLKGMRDGGELDVFLETKLSQAKPATHPPAASPPTQQEAIDWGPKSGFAVAVDGDKPRRRKGEVKRVLLSLLDRRASKHLKTLIEQMAGLGYSIGDTRMRAEMWTFKKDGLVESDQPGLFRLSEKGGAFLEGQKGESPAGTGPSGATSSVEGDL